VVDAEGVVIVSNALAERMFGYARGALVGHSVEALIPERFRETHVAHRRGFLVNPRTRPMGSASMSLTGRRRDGTEFPVEISLSPMKAEHGWLVMAAVRDITERKVIEDKLRNSLREKELLLKEVHHRVKNNLQVIAGLLYLQARGSNNQEVRATLDSSQIRVKAMALIHQLLYERKDFSQVHLPEYLQRLGALLARTYAETAARIELRVQADPLSIDLTRAVPCGLLVNELVANSFKYAFPDGRRGRIAIDLRHDGGKGMARLRVADDGIGLPPGVEPATAKTLGLQLVAQLCAQVGGRLTHGSGPGTEFEISFPVEPAADREQPA
jgi:PAS domain S-box-containing protein